MAETQSGSVHKSPMRRKPHARKRKNSLVDDLDFLARIRLRVIDPDLKHREALLQLFSTGSGAIPGDKFGFESAVHLKRVTRGGQFRVGSNHFIPIV